MGLSAAVACNCFKLGLCKPPPFPRELLILDQQGNVSLRDEFDTKDLWTPFDLWLQTCCEHPGMDFASEGIANWSGYRLFQEALTRAGWERFPVLAKELPKSDNGWTSPKAAQEAQAELALFCELPFLGQNAALIDVKSGFVIFQHIAAYEGVFIHSSRSDGVDVGVGEFEFFIRDRNTGADLFRATRVRQTLLGATDDNLRHVGQVRFEDLDSGNIYVGPVVVSGQEIPWPDGRMQNDKGQIRQEHPTEFHVEIRDVVPADFAHIIGALSRVFEAAVTTGNPVQWC